MFDIGFAELVVIAVVGLLVIGPERLPGAIRTAGIWLGRIRRGFNDIKREVELELHNDEVMRQWREADQQFRREGEEAGRSIQSTVEELERQLAGGEPAEEKRSGDD